MLSASVCFGCLCFLAEAEDDGTLNAHIQVMCTEMNKALALQSLTTVWLGLSLCGATKEKQKVLPGYNRSAPRPSISRGTSGKAAITGFGI